MNRIKRPRTHTGCARGFALTIAIVTMAMVVALAAVVLTVAYHQRRLAKVVESRTPAFYHAHAGVVDAQERIRRNTPPDDFSNPAFDPPAYSLDLDGDAVADVIVDISAENPATGLRTIQALGDDHLG